VAGWQVVRWLHRLLGLRSFPRPSALRAVRFCCGAFCFGALAPHKRADVDLVSAVRAFHGLSLAEECACILIQGFQGCQGFSRGSDGFASRILDTLATAPGVAVFFGCHQAALLASDEVDAFTVCRGGRLCIEKGGGSFMGGEFFGAIFHRVAGYLVSGFMQPITGWQYHSKPVA